MDMKQAFSAIGDESLFGSIQHQFDLMDIAEELIAQYKAKHPNRETELDAAFIICRWPAVLHHEAPVSLYRAHVSQILDMVLEGDVDRPTWLEMAAMVCEASHAAPIRSETIQWLKSNWEDMFQAFGIEEENDNIPAYDSGHGDIWYNELCTTWRKMDGGNRKEEYADNLERWERMNKAKQLDLLEAAE